MSDLGLTRFFCGTDGVVTNCVATAAGGDRLGTVIRTTRVVLVTELWCSISRLAATARPAMAAKATPSRALIPQRHFKENARNRWELISLSQRTPLSDPLHGTKGSCRKTEMQSPN